MDWITPTQHYAQSQYTTSFGGFSPSTSSTSPTSPTMPFDTLSPPTRKKRTFTDASLTTPSDPSHRLTKRLETLTLRNGLPRKPRILYRRPSAEPEEDDPSYIPPPKALSQPSQQPSDRMDLDTSIDTVYISDLDVAALSDSDAALDSDEGLTDEEKGNLKGKLIFVPDIEREMSRIPLSVLRAKGERERVKEGRGKELVLYGVPKSLSAEEGEGEGVRRAVEEARERFRRRMRGEVDGEHSGEGERRGGRLAIEAPPGTMDAGEGKEEGEGMGMVLGEVDADGDVDMDM